MPIPTTDNMFDGIMINYRNWLQYDLIIRYENYKFEIPEDLNKENTRL